MSWNEWDEVAKNVGGGKNYFTVKEGVNKFILLSPIEPLAQVFDTSTRKYRTAAEGETNVSVKGVCWVLEKDGLEGGYLIKQANLPYAVVKAIKGIAEDPEWEFKLPFKHPLTLTAEGAGTKEVKYTLTPSPKEFVVSQEILDELGKKPTPKEVVQKIKGEVVEPVKASYYPEEELSPEDIPF